MLKQRLQDDVKAAMKGGEKTTLAVLRLIMAAIKQREVDERIELDDEQVILVLDKMVKQRRESIDQYDKANREDLADQERFEITILQHYLPEALSDEEIEGLIAQAITEVGATSIKEMGKVVGQLKPKMQGRADMGKVSALVKQKLGA